MKIFTYSKSDSPQAAVKEALSKKGSYYIAGGTNLMDLMKESVVEPDHLVDVSSLGDNRIEKLPNGGVLIGAAVRNSDLASHELLRSNYPILSRALLSGASPQLRNMATVGGNIMQRTRCAYFYDLSSACNKRQRGSGCDAIEGQNRMHAILGGSSNCIAVHPSDMCVALVCLNAVIHLFSSNGTRKIPISEFYKVPGATPDIENVLEGHELITAVELSPVGFKKNWCYLKIRDRASYAFALVSVAAGLELKSGKMSSVRLALGGVATKPWQAIEAEKILTGKAPDERIFHSAADAALKSATAHEHNKFKVELCKRAIVRGLKIATGMNA